MPRGALLHFIHTPEFDDSLGDDDDSLRDVQRSLQANPEAGDRIRGTGGVRKLRVAARGRGKRSGARVLYYFVTSRRTVYLLLAYYKGETSDISEAGKKVLRALTKQLDDETG